MQFHRSARLRQRLYGILDQDPGVDGLSTTVNWGLIGLIVVLSLRRPSNLCRGWLWRTEWHSRRTKAMARMAERRPIAFGPLDRRSWAGALERFTCDQAAIGKIECYRYEMSDLPHELTLGLVDDSKSVPLGAVRRSRLDRGSREVTCVQLCPCQSAGE